VAEQGRGDVQRDPGADEEVLARHPSRVVTARAQAANFPPLPPFLIGIECNWEHEANDAASIVWGREVFDRLQMVRGAFGQNLGRLTAIKKQYDPTNIFRLNHNIALGQ
jgi:Berberine and berberine like